MCTDTKRLYVGVDVSLTFDSAQQYCQSIFGTSLATITSDTDNNNVYDASIDAGINGYIWIGASDSLTDGTWIWNDGTGAIDDYYTNWEHDEPNGGTNENCLEFRTSKEWNDASCSNEKPFVCNYDATTTGLTAKLNLGLIINSFCFVFFAVFKKHMFFLSFLCFKMYFFLKLRVIRLFVVVLRVEW